MYKLVIMDWDGTIADTREGAMLALNYTLALNNYPPIDEDYFNTIGHDGIESLAASAAGIPLGTNQSRELRDQYIRNYMEAAECSLFEGVYEALEVLQKSGIALALLTNKPLSLCEVQLRLTRSEKFFSYIQCDDGTVALKPAPDGVFRIANYFNVGIDDILMVGDSLTDMMAAKNAGTSCWFVEYGIGEIDLSDISPQYKISSFKELLSLLGVC